MKALAWALVALLPASAFAAPETASAGAERAFASAPLELRTALQPQAPREPFWQAPLKPSAFRAAGAPGALLASVDLSGQLDRNLRVANYKLGARPLDLGVATDAGFKDFYLTFSDRAGTVLGPLGDLNRLRGDGVDLRIDAATVYNFRLSINIFSPVRGSTLVMTPAAGTSGNEQDVKTGPLLDAVRARAALMTLGGREYWIFYGRDVLPGGGGFADTRSFLFVRMDGLSSKAWPLAESALRADVPGVVDLGGARAAVTRTSAGRLEVRAAD